MHKTAIHTHPSHSHSRRRLAIPRTKNIKRVMKQHLGVYCGNEANVELKHQVSDVAYKPTAPQQTDQIQADQPIARSNTASPQALQPLLASWHQHKQQQTMMPPSVKQQLLQKLQLADAKHQSQAAQRATTRLVNWRQHLDPSTFWSQWRLSVQGITAAIAVLFGWQLLYDHHQQTQLAFYQVQAYQLPAADGRIARQLEVHDVVLLSADTHLSQNSADTHLSQNSADTQLKSHLHSKTTTPSTIDARKDGATMADLAMLQQRYLAPANTAALHEYQQQRRSATLDTAHAHTKTQQLIVSRQPFPNLAALHDGWFLAGCDAHDMALTAAWLEHFQQQQGLSSQQWQQLQQSPWLQVTTGPQGQILAIARSDAPPRCAP